RINAGRCRPGIRAILDVAGRTGRTVTAADLGYVVGPRLNAAGRLDDMSGGIECLLAKDSELACQLAGRLHALNAERREIQANMEDQAVAVVDRLMVDTASAPAGLCLFQEEWHQGLVGLIAARMRERTNRPVVAFAPVDDEELKASARSVPGLHIRDLLDSIATRHPDLLLKFGGHAMAAGLSLKRSRFGDFSSVFADAVAAVIGEPRAVESIYSDGSLDENDLDVGFADLLRQATPWGQGFPEPVFDDEFDILEYRVIGDSHIKFRVRRVNGSRVLEAIAFRYLDDHADVPNLTRARMAFRLEVNEYQGRRTPQLVIEYMEPC
ncbi:MAG: DHHA1 domain-containing protein, partial [Gammaproteobacteria bacterium]|nr:DHHA1 domain-containing protein [Gammaproteobacteria bacterium]